MVKRPTWILLAILALAVGAYFIVKEQSLKASKLTPTPTENSYIITQADGVLQSLRISDNKGNTFQMQRDLSKTWVITAPKSGTADQGLAGGAETQVDALRIVVTLETPPDPSAIGLAAPAYTMEMGFVNGASHKIEVGNLTPTSSGYYVRFDGGKIYVIEQSGIDALLNLLKAPPFPATATPVSTAESTSTPAPEIVSPTP
ncbi:MAG: DUF4340 domain-containing protein [Anaerolineales bacterium]|jgi:hypothetical protein